MSVRISELYGHYKPLYEIKKAKKSEEVPPRTLLTQAESDEQFRTKIGEGLPSYFIVDFSIRPNDDMFDPKYRKKFKKLIDWGTVEENIVKRVQDRIGNEAFAEVINAGVEGETSEGRVICTVVVGSPRSATVKRLKGLIPPEGRAELRVKDPANQKFLTMVADDFCISFGSRGGEWFYEDWTKLANSLPY